MNKITDIVFDVGRVLIDVQYTDFITFLNQQGASFTNANDLFSQTDLISYERGQIGWEQFVDSINKRLEHTVSYEILTDKYLELFSPINEMIDFAAQLKQRYGVYLLSNTCQLHWEFLQREYDLEHFSHGHLTSYEVGTIKPEPEIFAAAEKRFNLSSQSTVFIDDLRTNVEGALSYGWQGIHHTDIAHTKERLALLGVR